MGKLNIIGIGTKKINDISYEGYISIEKNNLKYLRTNHHPFSE